MCFKKVTLATVRWIDYRCEQVPGGERDLEMSHTGDEGNPTEDWDRQRCFRSQLMYSFLTHSTSAVSPAVLKGGFLLGCGTQVAWHRLSGDHDGEETTRCSCFCQRDSHRFAQPAGCNSAQLLLTADGLGTGGERVGVW